MVLPYWLQKMMSGRPSPSRSPMATPQGLEPVEKSTRLASELFVKLPGVLTLRKIESRLLSSVTTAMSGLPSPSKSPMAGVCPRPPSEQSIRGANEFVVRLPAALMFRNTETTVWGR